MKTKWFRSNDLEEIEKLLNDFDDKYFVSFTQTHVTYLANSNELNYTAIVFYTKAKPSVTLTNDGRIPNLKVGGKSE